MMREIAVRETTRWFPTSPGRCSSVVEQLIRNQQVVSSILTTGSKRGQFFHIDI